MLIFSKRPGVVIRIPSVGLMLAGAWGLLALTTLAEKHSKPIPGWFAVVVVAVFALGTRIIRRVGDDFVVTGLRRSEHLPARYAVLGVRMRGGGRYWHLALDLMAHPDFGNTNRVEIDSFQPNGTGAIIRAARRAAGALGLPEPILAPGLVDGFDRNAVSRQGCGRRYPAEASKPMGSRIELVEVPRPDWRGLGRLAPRVLTATPRCPPGVALRAAVARAGLLADVQLHLRGPDRRGRPRRAYGADRLGSRSPMLDRTEVRGCREAPHVRRC